MPTHQAPEPEPFSVTLRSATWGDHRRAERSAYLDALLSGQLSREGYAAMVAQHYFVYSALEEVGDALRDDPVAGPFVLDELIRVPALEADLRYLLGDGWRGQILPSPATRRYRARLLATCAGWPGGFVAHHYTRYLGDLSGGQAIRSIVERVYRWPDQAGVRFYVFDGIDDPGSFKDRYRTLLDTAAWDDDEGRRIAAEVSVAYQLNTEVLDELGDEVDRHAVA